MSGRALWTIEAMAAAMGARRQGALPDNVPGLSIDSRTLRAGDAFFAIAGENRDGHAFVSAALKAGAGVAVVASDRASEMPPSAPLLVVSDVLDALRQLARAARARSQAKFIGVTGSVGKTGTKEALRLALSRSGETHASAASYNNHWGTPLSLARCPQSARFAVLEMGMNHAGEIAPLTRLVRPHIAIVTTVEPVHLEFFGTVEKIADAKAEIFEGIEPGGAAVINRDNDQFARLSRAAKSAGVTNIVPFGEHEDAQVRLIKCALQPDSSTVQARVLGTEVTYKLGAPGRHVVLNSLAVLAAAKLAGADLALAALALADLAPAAGRGARMTLNLPRRSRHPDRRKLQRQSGLDARRACPAGPGATRDVWPAHCRAWRHARAWPAGCRIAPQPGRRSDRQRRRRRILLGAADARVVGGTSLRAPRRLCGGVRVARG